MVRMSATAGRWDSVMASGVSRAAARQGRAAFLAPDTRMRPRRGCPPWITSRSIESPGDQTSSKDATSQSPRAHWSPDPPILAVGPVVTHDEVALPAGLAALAAALGMDHPGLVQ